MSFIAGMEQATEKLCWYARTLMLRTCGTTPAHSRRMLKKARLLTRPTLARRDAPYPMQGRSELSLLIRGGWDDPNCAQYSPHPALSAPRRALSRARAFWFSPLRPQGSSQTVLHCAHRGSTFRSCGLGEQEGWSGCSPPILLRPRVARA